MRFSVITATYKARHCLKTCLDSVKDNILSSEETEQIVVDNLSEDGSDLLVREYAHAKFFAERDSGIYDAMNKGIRLSSGQIVSFLNADDSYLPGTLAKVRTAFEEHPECSVVYGNILVNGKEFRPPAGLASFDGARIFHPAAFFKRELFEKYGVYEDSFAICADLDFFLRIRKGGEKFYFLNEPLSVFALDGVSTRRRHQTAKEVRQILISHGFGSVFAWGYYLSMELRAFASKILKRGRGKA